MSGDERTTSIGGLPPPAETGRGETWPLVIVGAGAAGLIASIFAARRGAAVLLLETRPACGAKIRVSGGGRCNVLPSTVELTNFATSGSRNSLRNLLFSWPLDAVRAFFERDLGLALQVEPNGKVFPASNRAKDVVDALLAASARAGAVLRTGRKVASLDRIAEGAGPGYRIGFEDLTEPIAATRVILATGGLSLPKTGSDGLGLEFARSLGHTIRSLHPALVPLLTPEPAWKELAGISLRVRLRAMEGTRLLEERSGDFLFTHRGFSGPVVLDTSRHITAPGSTERGVVLLVSWLERDEAAWERLFLGPGRRQVGAVLRECLPRRLADGLLRLAGVSPDRVTSALPREERRRLAEALGACPLPVSGSEGYATAEVTGGGVPLEEVSARALESRVSPGLHFAGEILDVVGHIGGYNFLWAWVTGRKAGEGAGEGERPGEGTDPWQAQALTAG